MFSPPLLRVALSCGHWVATFRNGKIFPLIFFVHWPRCFQVCWPFQRRGGNMTLLWFWRFVEIAVVPSTLQLVGPCSGRKEVLSLASRSPLYPSNPSTGSSLTCSGSSFFVAFCPPASAGVAVHSTALGTTAQVARGQGFFGRRGFGLESAESQ